MADTVRLISYLLSTEFQNGQPGGSITPQYMRDLIVTYQQFPIAFSFPGKPTTGQVINIPMPFAVTIPANLAGSLVYDTTTATSNAVFLLNRIASGNVVSAIGSVTITTTNHFSATFSTQASTNFLAGDVLQVVAPAQDSTLADITLTIMALRT